MANKYLDHLQDIANEDVRVLHEKEKSYGDSWKRRGGTGAYFVMIRKADRLETVMPRFGYDIFRAIETDTRKEGILDDIQDLRRYLALIEAEIIVRGNIPISAHTTTTSTITVSEAELKDPNRFTPTVTPGGMRKVPKWPEKVIPRPIKSSTEMESPFGYDSDLDDINDLDNP